VLEIEETVAIDKPIDAVRAFLLSETTEPLWQTTLAEVRRSSDAPLTAAA
jgi:hypothetical protein